MFKTTIFDWKRTLYDPDKKELLEGALDLLKFLRTKNVQLILIGKGGEDMQQEVNRLGVGKYFQHIIFAEGEKDSQVFIPYIFKNDPRSTCFIGDRIKSELQIGKQLGAFTIWIQQGKFAAELPENKEQEPDYIVNSLTDCLNLLKTFFFQD